MGNVMWHVALEPGTTKLQDVIVAELAVDDFALICGLLSTNRLKGQVLETDRGGYLLMYGGEYTRPYPSIMIWRIRPGEEKGTIENMQRKEDAWILKHVWRDWLMPEDTNAEYAPPGEFILTGKQSL